MDKEDIKKLREELKLSQTEFGAKVHVNYHTVGKWENGLQTPRESQEAWLKALWLETYGKAYVLSASMHGTMVMRQPVKSS